MPLIRSATPMSNDVLARVAPSVFATNAHTRTSDRYTFLPTIDIVEGLRGAGWGVVGAGEQRVRSEDRRGFQKHILRLRHGESALKVGDSIPELVLTNSHDASSAYQLHAGLFRLVCSNGLVIADATFSRVSVRHSGKARDEVIDASFTVLNDIPKITASVDSMRSVQLSDGEQSVFAQAALAARYGEEPAPIEAPRLLTARRYDDKGADLWSTFNRVQENLTQGGLRGRAANGRRMRTRAVTGIDADTKLNKALWTLAEEMRKLKVAA